MTESKTACIFHEMFTGWQGTVGICVVCHNPWLDWKPEVCFEHFFEMRFAVMTISLGLRRAPQTQLTICCWRNICSTSMTRNMISCCDWKKTNWMVPAKVGKNEKYMHQLCCSYWLPCDVCLAHFLFCVCRVVSVVGIAPLWKSENFRSERQCFVLTVKVTYSNYKSVHPALDGDEYYSEEDENLEAGYDEEKGTSLQSTKLLVSKVTVAFSVLVIWNKTLCIRFTPKIIRSLLFFSVFLLAIFRGAKSFLSICT